MQYDAPIQATSFAPFESQVHPQMSAPYVPTQAPYFPFMPAANATTIDHQTFPAAESCKCAEVNSRRYDSLTSRVQRLQTELETLQDQIMAPMQELQMGLQDVVVKTIASQLAEHEEYLVSTFKKILDSRSTHLEQHVTGTVAQLYSDLELVNQDLAWVAEKVDSAQDAGDRSLATGFTPSAESSATSKNVAEPTRGTTFGTIPVKTPYKPSVGAPDVYTPAVHATPQFATSTQMPAPAVRPQLPKTDEYPTYDGKVESSHRELILKIEQLKRARTSVMRKLSQSSQTS